MQLMWKAAKSKAVFAIANPELATRVISEDEKRENKRKLEPFGYRDSRCSREELVYYLEGR
jgi:hypothetical protein